MSRTKMGFKGKLYINTGTAESPVWAAIDIVRDITLTLSKEEGDDSDRQSDLKKVIGGMHDWSLEFELKHKPGDEGYEAIRDSYLTGAPVDIAAIGGAIDEDGNEGPRTVWEVMSFNAARPMGTIQTHAVTCKPTHSDDFDYAWVTSDGGSLVAV